MRAFRLKAVRDADFEEVAVPSPSPGSVLVEPIVAGLCATDIHFLHGVNTRELPVTMGHEAVGIVVATGPELATHYPYGLKPEVGSVVTIDPLIPCGYCSFCAHGLPNLCPFASHLGLWQDGVFAGSVSVPASRVYRLPATMSPELGIFIEPLACAIGAVRLASLRPGATVAVVGAGPFGLLITAVAAAAGAARVAVVEHSVSRHRLAADMGASEIQTIPFEPAFDCVFEAAGTPQAIETAFSMVTPGGTLILGGLSRSLTSPLDTNAAVMKAITIKGSVSHAWEFPAAAALLETRAVDPEPMISHRRAFTELPDALSLGQTPDSCKVLITF